MSLPNKATVDVIIGSPRDSFMETIKVVLKGYYPYELKHLPSPEALFDLPSDFTPLLAIIDGQDGPTKTNEWVQTTKMNFERCQVIVLHSSDAPLDFQEVKKNGADEIMHINFDREFISDMVLELAPIEMAGDTIPITSLMPVDLRDMEPEVSINFDVYVHLPANHRSILMRKSGDVVESQQLDKFKNLKQQMYIKKTQKKEFFEYARTVMSSRNMEFPVSMTEKFHRSKKAIYEIMAQFLNNTATDYSGGKLIYDKCKGIIADFNLTGDLDKESLFTEIFRFTGNNRTLYHDCICLSAYAAYFAQALGWSIERRENAALGGLLHNIGLSQLPAITGEKKVQDFTPEELKMYQFYPERSVNMVKNKKVPLSPDITNAIAQHRESRTGDGFPKALPGSDISDIGNLMIYAYRFHQLTALSDQGKPLPGPQAISTIRDEALEGTSSVDMITATQIYKKLKS